MCAASFTGFATDSAAGAVGDAPEAVRDVRAAWMPLKEMNRTGKPRCTYAFV